MGAINSVVNNMYAMYTNRQLGVSTNSKAKSTEKLSSGYRINRAADDAAGLKISEKMRFFIKGLAQGEDNIQDGISMVRTADGALGEVHDMLHRMKELSIKGLNGTMTHQDREACQQEIDQLYDAICQIAENTEFNTMSVLKGDPYVIRYAPREATRVKGDFLESPGEMPSAYASFSSFSYSLGGADITTQDPKDGKAPTPVRDENGNYITTEYKGDWTETLSDNTGVVLDFTGLANTTGSEFANALKEFVNTGFFTTCNTCNDKYNVLFVDHNGEYEYIDEELLTDTEAEGRIYKAEKTLSKTIYVDIDSKIREAEFLGDALTMEDSHRITKALVEQIDHLTKGIASEREVISPAYDVEEKEEVDPVTGEKKIVQRLVSSSDSYQYGDILAGRYKSASAEFAGHFTRFKAGNNPFKLAIYDFRDNMTSRGEENGCGLVGKLEGLTNIKEHERYISNMAYVSREPVNIQHGDGADFCSQIHLPELDTIFACYQYYGYGSIKAALTLEEYIPAVSRELPGTTIVKEETIPAHSKTSPTYEYQTIQAEYDDIVKLA